MSRTLAAYAFVVLIVGAVLSASLFERELVRVPSAFNGIVRVTENFRGVRFLKFGDDSAVQSFYDTHQPEAVLSPYVRVSLQALELGKVDRVLVIGMGGGVQGMAARRRWPGAWVDLVEIDPVVVDLAESFMGFRSDPRMRVHVADGAAFVFGSKNRYDVIFLDAFNGIEPPSELTTDAFFRSVAALLAPGGVVAANVVYRDVSPHYDAIVDRMRSVFGKLDIQPVPGGAQNRVIFTKQGVL